MFDIGMTELLVVGIVALIVVGPKDLPGMFRTVGRFTGKAKSMARDFQRAMNDAADEAGVSDVTSDLKNMTSKKNLGLDKLDDAARSFENWTPKINDKPAVERGGETAKLAEERAEKAERIREAAANKALERQAAERAAEEAKADQDKAPAKKAPAKKAEPKKTTAKAASKTTTAKKAAPKKAAPKKTAAKPAAKKTATKTAAKKTTSKTGDNA
ncbi:Sec-independent protein translocase protein TatB [Falsihalocynthiibacter sp. SS001]|uniref:Sec-independent protein translocase protein TatB n=1 Tax=Falsihalocynthiibacter sp. SS001 TaxID=3349698 RepID=UPI0036D2D07D